MSGRRPQTWRADQGPLAFRVFRSAPRAGLGPSVVLVHGIGMSHRSLARVHRALATTRTVYSVDLPGFGGLPRPEGEVDVASMAYALAEVIASLSVGPVILVGHSMGAQWTVELAVARPDLVAQLIIMGPVVDAEHRTLAAQMRALAIDTLREAPDANAIAFSDYARCGPVWYLAQARHMVAYPIEKRVALLKLPLLIIRGGHDPIAGLRWCRRLRDAAPRARLVLVPRARHLVQYSSPAATASAILAPASTG